MAARASVSALAALLVAATSDGGFDAATGDRDQQPGHDHRKSHSCLRKAARDGAERKARILSKHRPVLVRFTSATTRGTPRRQSPQQDVKRNGGTTLTSSAATSDGPPPSTTAFAGQSEGLRAQSDVVSPMLSLVFTERVGRHVVAAEAIPPGTMLLRETAFAWSLHPEFSGEFCAHCLFEIAGSTILCPKCGLVEYCSEACSTAALGAWHSSECLDPSSGVSVEPALSGVSPACRAALRALRRARRQEQHSGTSRPNKWIEVRDEELGKVPSAPEDAGATARIAVDGASNAASLQVSPDGCGEWPAVKLGHLQEHYTARSAHERESLETEAAVAAVLARGDDNGAASRAEGDGSSSSSNAEDDGSADVEACELFAAELATTLFKVSTNAFAVSSLRCPEPSAGRHVRPLTHAKVAVGVFLAAAMFNHSCVPNALAQFRGGEMRVVATRAIGAREPVTISYGPLASKISSKTERQEYLRRAYFFLCECAACQPPTAKTATAPSPLEVGGRARGGRDAGPPPPKPTEFSCGEKSESGQGACPGTLLLGVPPSPSPPRALAMQQACRNGEDGTRARNIPPPSETDKGKEKDKEEEEEEEEEKEESKLGLWCDCCGSRVPRDSVSALLAEDEEDRRLWEEAVVAMSDLEKAEEGEVEGRMERSGPSSRVPLKPGGAMPAACDLEGRSQAAAGSAVGSAASLALGRVVERVKWRDARLSPLSMRRAVAHDMHARILASQEDFAGAADACARALHVLVRRFAPEDQELGVEFLKLAELCFNAGWMDKCSAACRKARVSLGICLQPGDEQLMALDALQGLCRS